MSVQDQDVSQYLIAALALIIYFLPKQSLIQEISALGLILSIFKAYNGKYSASVSTVIDELVFLLAGQAYLKYDIISNLNFGHI